MGQSSLLTLCNMSKGVTPQYHIYRVSSNLNESSSINGNKSIQQNLLMVVAFVNICMFVDLGSIQFRGGVVNFFLNSNLII
jgi:hypothetical protein